MSIVVSDTSPLRALAHLGHVEWLQVLFQRVLLPPAVAYELRHPPPAFRPIEVTEWTFLEILAPKNASRVAELMPSLDVGEAEAIELAEEVAADILLIDEMAGREMARTGASRSSGLWVSLFGRSNLASYHRWLHSSIASDTS